MYINNGLFRLSLQLYYNSITTLFQLYSNSIKNISTTILEDLKKRCCFGELLFNIKAKAQTKAQTNAQKTNTTA